MGFLTNFFISTKERYLLSTIAELKKDKDYLLEQLSQKDTLIKDLLQTLNTNSTNIKKSSQNGSTKPLTKLESKIYNTFKSNPKINLNSLSKKLNLKSSSLRVYCSKIRKKGYNISFD